MSSSAVVPRLVGTDHDKDSADLLYAMDSCRKESVNRSHEQQKPMRKVEDERRGPHNGRRENVLPTIRQDANHLPLSKRNNIPLSQLSATSSKSAKMSIDMEYSRSTSSSGSGIPSNSIRDIVHSIASCRKPRTSLNTNSPAEDLANNRKAIKSRKTASIQPVVKTLNRGIIGLRLDPSSYISSSSSSSATLDDDTSSKNIDQNRRDAGTYKMVESQIIKSSTNSNDIDQSPAKTILFDDNTSDVPSKSLTHSFDLTPSKSMASIDNESNGFMPSIQSPIGDIECFVVNDANNASVDETRVTINSKQSVEGLPKETTQVITSSKNEEESHRYVEEECNSNMPAESVITIDKCHNPARPDEENDPISSREKETNSAHTAMPSTIPDNSTVGESFVINTRSVDSDQAVHQEIIESMSSLTLEEFSRPKYNPDRNYTVPTYEGLKHYQSSPSIIKNSNTLNRSIQTGAAHVGGLQRQFISDAPKFPQNAVSGVNVLQSIPSSTIHRDSQETMAQLNHGYSAPWNRTPHNLLNTQASGLASNLCTSLRPSIELSHDPMLYPRHQTHYTPYDHYTLTNNSRATGLPIKPALHPYKVNTQAHPTITLPQPQSCISGSYDCAHICQCSHCTGHRLNYSYNNLCPMVEAPSDMLRNVAKATFVSNSSPLHEMPIYREKIIENHDLNLHYPYHPLIQAHVLHSKGVPGFEGQCAYRRADDTREIRKSPLPISSQMDTTQIMSDNIAAVKSTRDYHDRLKTRKCFDPTRKTEISASINTCRNQDDISQAKLQQSEEKIHALQRVLHLAKAQHECLLEERNQRQVGRY